MDVGTPSQPSGTEATSADGSSYFTNISNGPESALGNLLSPRQLAIVFLGLNGEKMEPRLQMINDIQAPNNPSVRGNLGEATDSYSANSYSRDLPDADFPPIVKKRRTRSKGTPRTKGPNLYGRAGCRRCEQCRLHRQKCVYDKLESICARCKQRGWACGEKLFGPKAQSQLLLGTSHDSLVGQASFMTNFTLEAGMLGKHFGELPQIYPSANNDGSPNGIRSDSVRYINHTPVDALLSDGSSTDKSYMISLEMRDAILTDHLKWPLNSETVIQFQQYLTPEALSEYVNVYWRAFHPQYPILHQPTIAINRYEHLPLFTVMIEIGMSLDGDNNAHALSLAIHETLRWQIYSSENFSYPAKLWEMQILLLREIYDKMLARRHQHEMGHTFHRSLLTLMRQGTALDGFLYREDQHPESTTSITGSSNTCSDQMKLRWHDFIERESTKRVAFLAFIIDSQHSMIFGHALVLKVQEVNLKPPCNEDIWAAGSPTEWDRAMQRQHQDIAEQNTERLTFIDILEIFMNEPHRVKEEVSLDHFGRFIILHGLINVKWHLQQEEAGMGVTTASQGEISSPSMRSIPGRDHWKSRLQRALGVWRDSTHEIAIGSSMITRLHSSSLPLYRLANITLWTSILDLQILAGMSKIMGKPVKHQAGLNVLLRMSTAWANSRGALKSVYHALMLLTETYFSGENHPSQIQVGLQNHFEPIDNGLDGILHGKWCLYLATLTLWAWGAVAFSREGSPIATGGFGEYGSNVESVECSTSNFASYPVEDDVTAWRHAKFYLKAMTEAGKERHGYNNCPARNETRGLVVSMHNLLKDERWELLQEGSKLCFKILTGQHIAVNINSEVLDIIDSRMLDLEDLGL